MTHAATIHASPASSRRQQRYVPVFVYVMGILVAALCGGGIGIHFLGESLSALGIPDPGMATSYGLPFTRAATIMLLCIAIGSLMMASFGAQPNKDKYLSVDGYKAARAGSWALLLIVPLALLQVPLNLSDVAGMPLNQAISPAYWSVALEQISLSRAWLWVAGLALLASLVSFVSRKWIWQPLCFFLACLTLIPLVLEGHSASGGNHDIGTNSYIWHMYFAVFWVGGLIALITYGVRRGPSMGVIVRRYSFIALISVIVLALSGTVNALIRMRPKDLFTTDYGHVLIVKIVLLITLAVIGFVHRSRTIPSFEANPVDRRPFVKLAIFEVLLMATTMGVAVALSRIPPPPPLSSDLTQMQVKLGFNLDAPPSFSTIFGMWRLDLIFGVGAILLQVLYLWAYFTLRKRGDKWPISRLIWMTLGNLALFFASSSGLGMYAMAMFSPHMIQHMLLSMMIPVFWVVAGPITLFMRALPTMRETGVQGPREWLVAFVNNPVARFLTHPVVASAQFVASFYVFYFTNMFDLLVSSHGGHVFMMIHFIISGYIFYWVIIGVDAAPRHIAPFTKMLVLVLVMSVHAWFAISLMQLSVPLAADFYTSVELPFAVDLLDDQHLGGSITWATGEIPLLFVTAMQFVQWRKEDAKDTQRYERRAERDDNAELKAYNEMLGQMNRGEDVSMDAYYNEEYNAQDGSEKHQ